MNDKIEILPCGSVIQHGPFNDRIYLLSATDKDIYSLPSRLIDIAIKNGYGKIFAKLNETQSFPFLSENYIIEARVPLMYPRNREGVFLAHFLDKSRKEEENSRLYKENLKLARAKKNEGAGSLDLEQFKIRKCTEDDIETMKNVYQKVFATYPFPIHDISYLRKTMIDNVDYYCVENEGKIVALSSAEKDKTNKYAEMTDFATLPDWRGQGLAQYLLEKMERSMQKLGIKTAFTIARSASPGMNITFAKSGYAYGGRLKNNTNISGNIESMNIWYKKL
jgi:beta-lysine N6-acetyltransferase